MLLVYEIQDVKVDISKIINSYYCFCTQYYFTKIGKRLKKTVNKLPLAYSMGE